MMATVDDARFHNMETYRPAIGCTGRGPWDHLGNDLCLG